MNIKNITTEQMVVAMLRNGRDASRTATSLGITEKKLSKRIDQLDKEDRGTKNFETAISSHFENHLGGRSKDVYGKLNLMINKLIPKSLQEKHARAINYRESDDQVSSIVETLMDFAKSGFRVSASKDPDQKKIDEWNKRNRIENSFINKNNDSIGTNDVAVVMGNSKTKTVTLLPLPNLAIIPIHQVDEDGTPLFLTYMKLPQDIIDFIRKNRAASGESAPILKGIPNDWIDAAMHPHTRAADPNRPSGAYVELGKDGSGEKIYILDKGGDRDRLSEPTMVSIFAAISLRAFLQDGEFSIAYLSKFFIHQIKVGAKTDEPGLKGLLASKGPSPQDRTDLKNQYGRKVDKAILDVTDQFLEHIFIFPGSEIDFTKRYLSPEKKINRWGRISEQIVTGEGGGSFAAGTIYMKSYGKQIDRIRGVESDFLLTIYNDHLEIKGDVSVLWGQNYMKEAKQVLAEVNLMTDRGMDMQNAVEILGYNWEEWVVTREKTLPKEILKKKGKDDDWIYQIALQTPFFEDHQGQLDAGGRPEDDGGQTDDTGKPNTPRAAQ